MIQDFAVWSASRSDRNPFSALEGAVLAIEASFYLERLLTHKNSKEPLLSAIGGQPFALRTRIEDQLEILKVAKITPVFVFRGLDVGKAYDPFAASNDAVRASGKAWDLYNVGTEAKANEAVEAFGTSGYARPEDFYHVLQLILRGHEIPFQVAPYSACGQLAYLEQYEREGKRYVDAVAGSSEILLYNVDSLITDLNFETQEFTFIRRQTCIEELGLAPETFVDACLLSGTSVLPSLPQLAVPPARRANKLQAAADLVKSFGTGAAVATNYHDEPVNHRIAYLDHYKRTRLAVRHQVILTADGKVEPVDRENAPGDLHEVIGQRLPDELMYYLSRCAIGPRVLNYLTSGQINVCVPIDGGDSIVYKNLVRDQLTPLRSLTLSLLAQSLTRVYQHREVRLRCWFGEDSERTINLREQAAHKSTIDSWKVSQDTIKIQTDRNWLSFAVHSLSDSEFAAQTVASKSSKVLETKTELTANSIWRFLHLRGYVDDKHTLTSWGKVLDVALSSLPPSSNLEESVLLSVDLLRFGLLNSQAMFPTYTGGLENGSETDKANAVLLSRLACLLRLRHKAEGFTGPLFRQLLGYTSIITAVQSSLRDLLEMSLATLLLNGDADREAIDLTDLGLDLPLLLPIDCSLGIAMRFYLDGLAESHPSDPTGAEAKENVKAKGTNLWIPNALDFAGDLERAFGLWDALCAGLKVAGEEGLSTGKSKEEWEAVDDWVQGRR